MESKAFLWLQALVLKSGGLGMFVVTFFDSSILAFPFFPDAVVMELCATNPARMPYYVFMAATGSLTGCILLYALAKKGGEAYFQRHAKGKADKIREWVDHNAFLLGRGLRYFLEGVFAVKYGDAALAFLKVHGIAVVLSVLGLAVVLYFISQLAFRESPAK